MPLYHKHKDSTLFFTEPEDGAEAQSTFVFELLDKKGRLLGRVQDHNTSGFASGPSQREIQEYFLGIQRKGETFFKVEAAKTRIITEVPFQKEEYWAFDIPPPTVIEKRTNKPRQTLPLVTAEITKTRGIKLLQSNKKLGIFTGMNKKLEIPTPNSSSTTTTNSTFTSFTFLNPL